MTYQSLNIVLPFWLFCYSFIYLSCQPLLMLTKYQTLQLLLAILAANNKLKFEKRVTFQRYLFQRFQCWYPKIWLSHLVIFGLALEGCDEIFIRFVVGDTDSHDGTLFLTCHMLDDQWDLELDEQKGYFVNVHLINNMFFNRTRI